MTYTFGFANEVGDSEELACLDCNISLAQGPADFNVHFMSPPTCIYSHHIVRRPIPVAVPERPYFNAEDDCWYDVQGRFETVYDVVGRAFGKYWAQREECRFRICEHPEHRLVAMSSL